MQLSLSRVFALVLLATLLPSLHARSHRRKEEDEKRPYWWENDYNIIKKIGEGYRGEVFRALRLSDMRDCVIKVYKETRSFLDSVRREIDANQILRDAPNTIKLLKVLKDPRHADGSLTGDVALVFDLVTADNQDDLFPTLTDLDVRHYMFQLLTAIAYAHSKNILHLDIRPANFLIDHEKHQLYLIDWGRARLYHPKSRPIDVSPASTRYSPAEHLLGMGADFGTDMWAFGQVMGGMIFLREPNPLIDYREGSSDSDDDDFDHFQLQVKAIGKFLGTDGLHQYLFNHRINLDYLNPDLKEYIGKSKPIDWDDLTNSKNDYLVSLEAIDLLKRIFQYESNARITAQEALKHRYFDPVRAEAAETSIRNGMGGGPSTRAGGGAAGAAAAKADPAAQGPDKGNEKDNKIGTEDAMASLDVLLRRRALELAAGAQEEERRQRRVQRSLRKLRGA